MRSKISILVLIVLCLISCGKKKGMVHVSGELEGLTSGSIYIYGQDASFDYIDTIPVHNGKFNIQIHADTLSAAYLFINNAEYPIYFEAGDHIKIKGDVAMPYSLDVTGNSNNDDFADFKKGLKKKGLLEQMDFTGNEILPTNPIVPEVENFISKHNSSPVCLYLIDKYMLHQATPNYTHVKEVIKNLSSSLQNSPRITNLNDYIIRWEKSRMGAVAPDFNLPDNRGIMMSRSSVELKNKYILLSFWASWAGDKAQTVNEIKGLYRTFSGNPKFAMVCISLDTDKGEWNRSIKQDSLQGTQLCDFSGFSSPIVNQYAISNTPAYFLIAPDGIILARDMKGEALRRQITTAIK